MPFTPAHAAAAAPLYLLSGRRLSVAALIVGTLSPDFEYFIHQEASRPWRGHSLPGLIYFCLPTGLLVLAIFRWVQPGLAALLPPKAGWVAIPSSSGPRPTVFALLLGALSHVAWDAFTHRDGWATLTWPDLFLQVFFLKLPLYKTLQYGFGLGGLLFCGAWFYLISRRFSPKSAHRRHLLKLWVAFLGMPTIIAALRFVSLESGTFDYRLVAAVLAWMTTWVFIVGAAAGAQRYLSAGS